MFKNLITICLSVILLSTSAVAAENSQENTILSSLSRKWDTSTELASIYWGEFRKEANSPKTPSPIRWIFNQVDQKPLRVFMGIIATISGSIVAIMRVLPTSEVQETEASETAKAEDKREDEKIEDLEESPKPKEEKDTVEGEPCNLPYAPTQKDILLMATVDPSGQLIGGAQAVETELTHSKMPNIAHSATPIGIDEKKQKLYGNKGIFHEWVQNYTVNAADEDAMDLENPEFKLITDP